MEVNLLDWGIDEKHFEDVLVLDGGGGGIEFPGPEITQSKAKEMKGVVHVPPSLLGLDR